jgi:hypothetical protein
VDNPKGKPRETTAPLASCLPWCVGVHPAPPWGLTSPPTYHQTADCPSWCFGHPAWEGNEDDRRDHHSDTAQISLSLAAKIDVVGNNGPEMIPDYLGVNIWHLADDSAPTVNVCHGDDYLPDMTPAEALALAVALAQAAWRVQPDAMAALEVPSPEGYTCPPWCVTPHTVPDERHLSDEYHLSDSHTVPTAREHHGCRAGTCELGVSADLVHESGAGPVTVEIYHGDEVMPRLTVAGAATFALGLLAEVATAAGMNGRNPQ